MDRNEQLKLYKKFLMECTRNPNSANNYSDFKRINECIQDLFPEKKDISILDFDDAIEFRNVVEQLNSLQKYIDYNGRGNNQYSNAVAFYQCFLNAKKLFVNHSLDNEKGHASTSDSLQQIYFGTPGSGKSFAIKKKYEMSYVNGEWVDDEEKKAHIIRTTFHPDTDYASFVGCYKPVTEIVNGEKKITYTFVPQAFTEAYVKAWNDLDDHYYLILEEINRGNCAQIFGDLFQLLDRKNDGWSEYPVNADSDLKDYLLYAKNEESVDILQNKDGIKDGKLCLPPNLSIIASMNTSDQSLFPMDSAFKRRWSWEYVPIDYNNPKSAKFTITIGYRQYKWHNFLKRINEEIKKVTSSEDKQMGNFFIKHDVDEKEFKDKVMFYIWSEVGKDNFHTREAVFCYIAGNEKVEFSFNELYPNGTEKIQKLMERLGVSYNIDEDEEDFDDDNPDGSSQKDMTKYSINGEGAYPKNQAPYNAVKLYVENNPEATANEIIAAWSAIGTKVTIILSDEEYNSKLEASSDGSFAKRYFDINLNNDETIHVFKNFNVDRINDLMNKVNAQDWGIRITPNIQ